jgi:hypothetical protein
MVIPIALFAAPFGVCDSLPFNLVERADSKAVHEEKCMTRAEMDQLA